MNYGAGALFPKRKKRRQNQMGGSNETDYSSKRAQIGNQRQYLHVYSKASSKRPKTKLTTLVKMNQQFNKGRWQSYDSNTYINPMVANPFTSTYTRAGLSLPLNYTHNAAENPDKHMCPVYAINITQLLRNHRLTGVSAADPLNTYPAMYSCPVYRLMKNANMSDTGTYPKYTWECVFGKHNGYNTAQPIQLSGDAQRWFITDSDYTNKPVHNYIPQWTKIKLYLLGCLRPRIIKTAYGFFMLYIPRIDSP